MKRAVLTSQTSRSGEFHRARGFSLIEMLIAVAIVTAVIAAVVQGITKMQRRSFVEGSKIDTVRETRDFIDQMVRDVHNVGYPPPKVNSNPGANCTTVDNQNAACCLIYLTASPNRYEAT